MFSLVFFPDDAASGKKVCMCDSYIEAYKRATDYIKTRHHGEDSATTVILDFARKYDYDVSDERTIWTRGVSYIDRRGKRIGGHFILMYKEDRKPRR